jgi:hypothetical protein
LSAWSRYDRIAPWYRFGEWTILLAGTLDEPVDLAYFSLSYSVPPEREPALDAAWEAIRPGGSLAIMDAGIPANRLRRLLAPAAEVLATVFPSDPYSEPWRDLARLSPSVQVERFQFGLYFICTARKQ